MLDLSQRAKASALPGHLRSGTELPRKARVLPRESSLSRECACRPPRLTPLSPLLAAPPSYGGDVLAGAAAEEHSNYSSAVISVRRTAARRPTRRSGPRGEGTVSTTARYGQRATCRALHPGLLAHSSQCGDSRPGSASLARRCARSDFERSPPLQPQADARARIEQQRQRAAQQRCALRCALCAPGASIVASCSFHARFP